MEVAEIKSDEDARSDTTGVCAVFLHVTYNLGLGNWQAVLTCLPACQVVMMFLPARQILLIVYLYGMARPWLCTTLQALP